MASGERGAFVTRAAELQTPQEVKRVAVKWRLRLSADMAQDLGTKAGVAGVFMFVRRPIRTSGGKEYAFSSSRASKALALAVTKKKGTAFLSLSGIVLNDCEVPERNRLWRRRED